MKGNLARSGLCSFVTSVDFGLYSSIVGTRCDCWVWAIRGHNSAEPAASTLTKAKIVRQNLIRQLPVSKSRTIASHEQELRLPRLPETDPRRWHKFSIAKKISTGSAGHKIRRRVDMGSFSIKATGLIPPSTPDGLRLADEPLATCKRYGVTEEISLSLLRARQASGLLV